MNQVLSRQEAAAYLGIRPQTLADWAYKSRGPIYSKLGNSKRSKVVYLKDDLDAFLKAWVVDSVNEMKG